MNKDQIKSIFAEIETPPHDFTEAVMRNLPYKVRRPAKRRIALILAAAITLLTALTGGSYLIQRKGYDFYGGVVTVYEPWHLNAFAYRMSAEQLKFETDFYETNPEQMHLVVHGDYSGAVSSFWTPVTEHSEVQSLISGSIIKLPAYIPDGYHFTEGGVQYYYEQIDPQAVPEYSEEKFGQIYEIYRTPAVDTKNVMSVTLVYENDKGGNFVYTAHLANTLNEYTHIYAGFNSRAEVLELPNYANSLFVSDGGKKSLNLYNKVAPITVAENSMFNKRVQKKTLTGASTATALTTYEGILYYLNTTSLERGELLKISENMR